MSLTPSCGYEVAVLKEMAKTGETKTRVRTNNAYFI
jgi:hypothetical protein